MSEATPTDGVATASNPGAHHRKSKGFQFSNVLTSELTKLRSVRSTYWTLFAAVVMIVGLGSLFSALFVANYSHINLQDRLTFDPTNFSLRGLFLAQLAIGILGVIVVTGEYASGMIKSTFAAVPQRVVVFLAKTVVFAIAVLIVCEIASFIAFFIAQAIFTSKHIQASISDPGVLRAVFGAGFYLTLIGLLGVALGTLIRHTAGAIAILVAVLLILPILAFALPTSWQHHFNQYLPSNAGQQIFAVRPAEHMLGPWTGFGLFCAYIAVTLAVAFWLLTRRDA